MCGHFPPGGLAWGDVRERLFDKMSARCGEHIARLRERGYRRARTRRVCLWPRPAGLARPGPPRRSGLVRRRPPRRIVGRALIDCPRWPARLRRSAVEAPAFSAISSPSPDAEFFLFIPGIEFGREPAERGGGCRPSCRRTPL